MEEQREPLLDVQSLLATGTTSSIGHGFDALIAAARAGSSVAIGKLLENCRNYLLLIANRALDSDLRPKVGASDLVQDTFVEAHRGFPRFQGTTETELLAWLTTILGHRLANNNRRYRFADKRSVDREVSLDADCDIGQISLLRQSAAPHHTLIADDEAQRLRTTMERLSEPFRTVIQLRTWERLSYAEIAVRMQGTPESVRKMWGRAVRQLEAELRKLP